MGIEYEVCYVHTVRQTALQNELMNYESKFNVESKLVKKD